VSKSGSGAFSIAQRFSYNTNMKSRKDLLYLLLLFALGVIFWAQALKPGQVFFLRDLSEEIAPKRAFWVQSGGFVLWSPHFFLGMPYAANPQSEAFYPLNFIFTLAGAERGLVYYIVFHHLFFMLTLYLALRRMGFGPEAGLLGAIGFGFGGYVISLTLLPVVFSTVTWFPLLMIFLRGAVEGKWLLNSLLAGVVMALQILAGEVQVAAMTWAITLAGMVFTPACSDWRKDFFKATSAMAFALAFAVILSFPQISLSRELLSLSNRGPGLSPAEAFAWPVQLSTLKSLLIPNYLLPVSARNYWGMGFFSGYQYFLTLYITAILPLFSIFSLVGAFRRKAFFWLALAIFGLVMMLGEATPVYGFFYRFMPGLKLFRIPLKFFIFLNFSLVAAALLGFEQVRERSWNRPMASALFFLSGIAIAVLLLAYPVRVQEFADKYQEISDFLFIRAALRVSSLALLALGLIFIIGVFKNNFAGVSLALLLFLDLHLAHQLQNPAIAPDFYSPNYFVRELREKRRDQVTPPRIFDDPFVSERFVMLRAMDPVVFYGKARDFLRAFWPLYFGLDNISRIGSFYPSDAAKFRALLADPGWDRGQLILARAGVEYIYSPRSGFRGLTGTFPRAMVFYQARAPGSQDEIIKIWADPNFAASQILLLEPGKQKIENNPALMMSHPAKVVKYENEKVVIEAEAGQASWLLLLDAYYPGWKAEVDGERVEILRADGFFRAVKIPAGRHIVSFSYFPEIFKKSLYVSGAGCLAWMLLLVLSIAVNARRRA